MSDNIVFAIKVFIEFFFLVCGIAIPSFAVGFSFRSLNKKPEGKTLLGIMIFVILFNIMFSIIKRYILHL